MPESNKPRGILKNAPQAAPYKTDDANNLNPDTVVDLDRKQVIENTKLNSKLAKEASAKGELIRAKIEEEKRKQGLLANNEDEEEEDDHLKWDEKNILLNEQEKSATMKIDEPKTPYEGGFDPNNDYYRTDNEDEEPLEEISLGEALVGSHQSSDSLSKSRIEVVPQEEQEQEPQQEEGEEGEEDELSPEEKHKLFELKRKQHYHLKGSVLHHPIQIDDEDEDVNVNK